MRPRRRVQGKTDDVVIVGAGLGGLSAALRLAGAGRRVRILEARSTPGGAMGRWESEGFSFDTGPSVLTMPWLIDEALACVGESRSDWLELLPLAPSYRASYADGSVLNSYSDRDQMADEVARVCGSEQARAYLDLVDFLSRLYRVEFEPYLATNLDRLTDLVRPQALTLLRMGGLRSLDKVIGGFVTDDRLRRLFTFQALYAGLSPRQARGIYAIISYLDSVAGVWFPRGGMHAVAQGLAGAALKHGVQIDYETRVARVSIVRGRARGVVTEHGEHIDADVVVLNTDLLQAYEQLLPDTASPRRFVKPRIAPSAFVWHVGAQAPLPTPAHHCISFGTAWRRTFDEIISTGKLMSDPSLLITSPSVTDPAVAPPGCSSYFVLAPCPNTDRSNIDWAAVGPRYRDEIAAVLAARGFDQLGAFSTAIRTQRWVTPADWKADGLSGGSPFALAHTLAQTGPLRHRTQHPVLDNLLFCGAGVQPGVGVPTTLISGRLAAERVTG